MRLASLGLLDAPPTGVFDSRTRSALENYRKFKQLPGGLEIDPLLAVSLLGDSSS
jgi:peptidoglycan hydrolase-like protein with peptidoglycan-binding domain